jgi:hypothetical protein
MAANQIVRWLFLLLLAGESLAFQQSVTGGRVGGGTVGGTTLPPDVTAPTITNINCGTTPDSITCTWNTNEVATTQICRGPTGGPYSTCSTFDATLTASHAATLSGLTPSTQYFFVVKSQDGVPNLTTCNSDGAPRCPSGTELTATTSASGGTPAGLVNDNSIYKPPHYSDTQPFPNWAGVTVTRASNVVTASVTSDPTAQPRIVVGDANFQVTALNCVDTSFNGNFTATSATASPAEVKWAQTGANTSTTCTVRAKALVMPAVGGTWTDPVFGTLRRRVSNAGHNYATKVPYNTTGSLLLDGGGAGFAPRVMNLANRNAPVQLCDLGGSLTQNHMWSRTDANTLFYQSGNQVRKRDTSTGACADSLVRTFSEYTSLMNNNEGDLAPGGEWIPAAGNLPAGAGQEIFCYNHVSNTKTTPVNIGTVFLDNVHCYSDGSVLANIRGATGPTISSIQRISATVMRVQVSFALGSDEIVVGRKLRVMGGQYKSTSANQGNGLWTICDSGTAGCQNPTTTVIYVTGSFPVDFGTISGAVSGWEVYSERRGAVYYSSAGALLNILGASAHGQVGEQGGVKYWVAENFRNVGMSSALPAGCTAVGAGYRVYASTANWPAVNTDDREAAKCAFDGLVADFSQGGHMSVFGEWMMYTLSGCNTAINLNQRESDIGNWNANWQRNKCVESVVRNLNLGDVYRVQHIRSRSNNNDYEHQPRCAFSQFKAGTTIPHYIACNVDLIGNGTPSTVETVLVP